MRKPFIIKKRKRIGINNITKQKVNYINLIFIASNKEEKSKVLKDANGKRVEWFVEPRDSHQKQFNKESDKQLFILISDLELQRDKNELTFDMIKRDIEVQKNDSEMLLSWREFCKKHCDHRISSHLRNYLSFIARFHNNWLSLGVKEICTKKYTATLIDTMKDGINGVNGVTQLNGKLYSPVTLNHYYNTHFICVTRAYEFGFIDQVPPNLKGSIRQVSKAKNDALDEQKGRYTNEELSLINDYLEDIKTINPRVNKLTYPERELALKMFLFSVYYTGLRESDLVTLKWSHIEEHSDEYYKLEKKMKKTKQIITIIFPKSADKYLGERKGDDDFVFPVQQYVGNAGIHALWSSIKKKLELKNGNRKVLSFGMCRHTHAYLLIDKVSEKDIHFVQTRLGHRNIQTTLKHYTKKPLSYFEAIAKELTKKGGLEVI
jgi:hypothetical protein